MNESAAQDDLCLMRDNCLPEICPGKLERRYDKAREWLVDAVSLATAAAADLHYDPNGFLAFVIVFIGAYALAHYLADVVWLASDTVLTHRRAPSRLGDLRCGDCCTAHCHCGD